MIGRKHKQEVYIPVPLVNLNIYTWVLFFKDIWILCLLLFGVYGFSIIGPQINFTESCLCYIIEDIEEMMFNMFGGWKLDVCLYMEQKIHWK